MVRGNWQKRVETAEARRKEAKQRKQKNDERKQSKLWVQDLLSLLDKHADLLNSIHDHYVHIWTDILPSDGPPLLDFIADDDSPTKRRTRGNSIGDTDYPSKGRGRSNSVIESKSKKKIHPRSRETSEDVTVDDTGIPLLCRSHFFFGKCEESNRRKGNCRHFHYPAHAKTLAQVLSVKERRSNQQELIACDATLEEPLETEATMDMIYHIPIELSNESLRSEQISIALSGKGISFSNIVYVALNSVLLFDRNREGIVINDEDLTKLVGDHGTKLTHKSSSSEPEAESSNFNSLPGAILELMLTFLPDNAVATSSQVCKAWNHEIGRNSPQLWSHLLKRRGWPLPVLESSTDNDNDNGHDPLFNTSLQKQQRYRDAFLGHYAAIRDARAIQTGLSILEGSKKNSGSREMAFQDFSTRKFAPSESNYCVSVHTWGGNRILASYDRDCSLRLFESRTTENNEITCKELIYQSVDPYKNTKKRKCRLLGTCLDEECIGSLCLVSTDHVNVHAYILVVINRDDFLLGGNSFASGDGLGNSDSYLNVIDIGEAVLNYMFNTGYSDTGTVQIMSTLVEFLQDGGEVGQIDVSVSHSFAACGHGRFMLDISIVIPGNDGESTQVGRKLVLFSASVGAIVWVGECPLYDNLLLPTSHSVNFASIRRRQSTGSRKVCSIAVSPRDHPGQVVLLDIEPSGEVLQAPTFECPKPTRLLLQDGEWVTALPFRSLVLNSAKIVVVDNFYCPENKARKLLVTILPRQQPTSSSPSLTIEGMVAIQSICIRDEYLFILCVDRHKNSEEENPVEALDGQWFGTRDRPSFSRWVIIIHTSTCHEIGRHVWQQTTHHFNEDPRSIVMTADAFDTIGVGLSWKGIIMTGNQVRSEQLQKASIIIDVEDRNSKKKKKNKAIKSSKKDGFARGMTLRG